MNESRTINCEALRTLHELDQVMRNHFRALIAIKCEDPAAAAAIEAAMEHQKAALKICRDARQVALGR